MNVKGFVKSSFSTIVVAVLTAGAPSLATAQDAHSHGFSTAQSQTQDQKNKTAALVKVVREVTERFKDPAVAEAEGYHLLFGCVSGPDAGAMGMHFVNGALVGDGEIDASKPEIVIYEPQPNGRLRLIGADYLVLADAVERDAFIGAGADGPALSPVRSAQPLRAPGVLHAARVGVEGQPDGHVRELEPQRVV